MTTLTRRYCVTVLTRSNDRAEGRKSSTRALPRSLCLCQDRRVVLQRSRRGRQIYLRRQHDLIQRQAVFPHLNPQRVHTARGKVNQRPQFAHAPAIVLPAPATQPAAKTILQIYHLRTRTSDPALRYSLPIHTVTKLDEHRVVVRTVILRFAPDP